jgi:hypothetical protein
MVNTLYAGIRLYCTSGFWPRVRARALRAPVFLGSLPRQTGRCAPPPPPIAASLLLIRPPIIFTIYRTWAANVKSFFLSTGAMKYRVPCPRPANRSFADPSGHILGSNYGFHILTVCCITDMHINDLHISVIYEGFFEGAKPFLIHLGSKL